MKNILDFDVISGDVWKAKNSASAKPRAVLHLIDSLAIGGAERVAVNLVNHLPRERFVPHLCATRGGGPLEKEIKSDVSVVILNKKSTVDLAALRKLYRYIRDNNIEIIHAHSSSLFAAFLVGILLPSVRLIWHVHFGRYAIEKPNGLIFRILLSRFKYIIAVNQPLVDWLVNDLSIEANKI
ncbi:MAG: glycosyltransferase, partial [Desulfobulbaceae bacterium]|nr:glycosyltransferase [Desulfobulbaceae bacterium]